MEEIGKLIGKGFGIWKKNLNLCIPFICSGFASILIVAAFFIAMFLAVMPFMDEDWTHVEDLEDSGLIEELFAGMDWQDFLPILILFLGMIVVLSLVGSYFNAGAIGMTRQALVEGKSRTSAMWSAGMKHFWNMFLLSLIMGLATMAGLIFLLPGMEQLTLALSGNLDNLEGLGVILAGFLLFILYALVLSVILALAPYALVLEGAGPVQAMKAGIDFFRYNKFDVFILWLVVAALSLVLQMIGSFISTGNEEAYQLLSLVTSLVSLLVLAPLANLWWTRLYMIRKGMLKEEEVKDPW
jgi:hypothetical protein